MVSGSVNCYLYEIIWNLFSED